MRCFFERASSCRANRTFRTSCLDTLCVSRRSQLSTWSSHCCSVRKSRRLQCGHRYSWLAALSPVLSTWECIVMIGVVHCKRRIAAPTSPVALARSRHVYPTHGAWVPRAFDGFIVHMIRDVLISGNRHKRCKLRLPRILRSSLLNDLVHCKLKQIYILYNDHNYTELEVSAMTMTRTCTGNCWNSYEFHRWIRNS
eukprot:COSAG02_NODE_746_length_17729_cov_37.532501_1_plen_196_part_00